MNASFSKKEKIILGIVVLFYVVGVIGFSLTLTHALFTKLTPLILLLSAVFLAYYDKTENRKNLSFYFLFVFIASFLVEMVGTNTGVLFGDYAYGRGLGIKLWRTPLLIGVNWVLLVYITSAVFAQKLQNGLYQIIFPTLLMVGYDIVMEQIAAKMDMWYWVNGSIPLQNYAMWGALAVVFHVLKHFFNIHIVNKMALPLFVVQVLFFLFILMI